MRIEDDSACISHVLGLVDSELSEDLPDLVSISISLGLIEASLTNKAKQQWPNDYKADAASNLAAFARFAESMIPQLDHIQDSNIRLKVKTISDSVWANLTGAYSNDIQHVQHLSTFSTILVTPKGQGKRQLDCAGVVLAVLLTCYHVARHHARHAQLAECRLQVSEDHCWVNYSANGSREGSVEVTTDSAASRGKEVAEAAWRGWLYTGGNAVLCSHKMAIAALVTSLNPSIIPRQNTGTDSEPLQRLQLQLLELIRLKQPDAMYPAALCALADLQEIDSYEGVETAMLAAQTDEALVEALRSNNGAQVLFEEAIEKSGRKYMGAGRCWYPYSYLVGYLLRRARLLMDPRISSIRGSSSLQYASELVRAALQWCNNEHAACVLQRYRFSTADDQLYKDVEGVFEGLCEALAILHKFSSLSDTASHFIPLLELWDGICACWICKPKPASWIQQLLRTAKLFSPECRKTAAANAKTQSYAMAQAKDMWVALKLAQLRAVFETADVESERTTKRPRRH